jgi:hypothetical protein
MTVFSKQTLTDSLEDQKQPLQKITAGTRWVFAGSMRKLSNRRREDHSTSLHFKAVGANCTPTSCI